MPTSTQVIAFDAGCSAASGKTTKNYSSIKTMPLSSAPEQDASLYAPLPFALGSTIISSRLEVYQDKAATGGSRTLAAQALAAPGFTESKIHYSNRPGVTGPIATLSQGDGGAAGRVWSLDTTAIAQAASSGTPWFGFRITSNIAAIMSIFSSENSKFRPVWVNVWSVAPTIPTMLSPAGGRAVSLARPTHRFDFVDTVDDALSGFRIQYSASDAVDPVTGAFVTPTYDTGTVIATQPSWVPGTDIAIGATTFWQVKTRDQANLWSPWSVPVSFVRTAKNPVTITNPAASPNDFVTEATPPITASFPGTVKAYQIFIVDPANSTTILHDSKKITGSTIAYTLPAGVLTKTGIDYKVIVRVWDDVVREATAGDTPYVDASRVFKFELSATVAPVTSLAIGPPGVTHGAPITFESATAPDAFLLRAGGVVTGDEIAPSEIFVSGTSYSLGWYGGQPHKEHDVEVLRVVNGITSAANLTVPFTADPEGIWLSGERGENPICILTSGDVPAWGSTEISATHQAVGTPFAVVRTQTLGSAKSSVQGFLVGGQDELEAYSIDDWEANAEALQAPAGQKLRLALTNKNIPVTIYNMVISPANEDGDIAIAFDFTERA